MGKCVLLFLTNKIHNLQILAAPIYDHNTVLTMFKSVDNVSNYLVKEQSYIKLLSVAKYVVRNMTGAYQRTVKRLEMLCETFRVSGVLSYCAFK